LAGPHYNYLLVADPSTYPVLQKVGSFSDVIRPFTVNGSNSLGFVNVNQLLGFEIGDLKTGKELFEVQVKGYASGHALRHGCPSHGIALTPDEKELWLADGVKHYVHVFDTTAMPPKQIGDIQLSDSPGWITFDIGAKYVFPSTGDVIDRRTKRIIAALRDETGAQVESENSWKLISTTASPLATGSSRESGRTGRGPGARAQPTSRRGANQIGKTGRHAAPQKPPPKTNDRC